MARRGRESRRWGRRSACLCVSGGGAPRGRDGAMVGALARGAQGAASLGAERAGSSTTCSRLQLLGVDRTCGKRYGGELSGCALGCAEAHRSSSLARRHAAHPSHRCRKGRTPRESPAFAPPATRAARGQGVAAALPGARLSQNPHCGWRSNGSRYSWARTKRAWDAATHRELKFLRLLLFRHLAC